MKSNTQFTAVYKRGKAKSTDKLTMVYFPNMKTKIGFSIGKKIGKSVKRNKLKRQLKACVGQLTDKFTGCFHIVFIPKPELSGLPYTEVCNHAVKLLGLAGIVVMQVCSVLDKK